MSPLQELSELFALSSPTVEPVETVPVETPNLVAPADLPMPSSSTTGSAVLSQSEIVCPGGYKLPAGFIVSPDLVFNRKISDTVIALNEMYENGVSNRDRYEYFRSVCSTDPTVAAAISQSYFDVYGFPILCLTRQFPLQ